MSRQGDLGFVEDCRPEETGPGSERLSDTTDGASGPLSPSWESPELSEGVKSYC